MDKVGLTFTSGHSTAMVTCWCGAVFQASGSCASVDRKVKRWQERHIACVEPLRTAHKVFWLSFCDAERPEGQQFLGACLIDVTAEEAHDATIDVLSRSPFAQPGAEWIAAAIRKAHRLGCNPGGEVGSIEVPADHPMLAHYRVGELMDRATIKRLDSSLLGGTC